MSLRTRLDRIERNAQLLQEELAHVEEELRSLANMMDVPFKKVVNTWRAKLGARRLERGDFMELMTLLSEAKAGL